MGMLILLEVLLRIKRDKQKKVQKVDRKDGGKVDGHEISKLFYGAPKPEADEPQKKVNREKSNGKKKTTK